MKTKLKKISIAILTGAILAVITNIDQANAQIFGVKFEGTEGAATDVTGTAGVVAASNWNNIANVTYTTGTITSSDGLSNATLTLSGPSAHNTWRSGMANDGGNSSLLNGLMDVTNGGPSTITVTGLVSGQAYNLYIYEQGDNARPGNNGDLLPNYSVNGGPLAYTAEAAPGTFTGFVQGSTVAANDSSGPYNAPLGGTDTASNITVGNYLLFQNVVATGGTITFTAGADTTTFRSPVNGFELVAAVPEPSDVLLTVLGLGVLGGFFFLRRHSEVC